MSEGSLGHEGASDAANSAMTPAYSAGASHCIWWPDATHSTRTFATAQRRTSRASGSTSRADARVAATTKARVEMTPELEHVLLAARVASRDDVETRSQLHQPHGIGMQVAKVQTQNAR